MSFSELSQSRSACPALGKVLAWVTAQRRLRRPMWEKALSSSCRWNKSQKVTNSGKYREGVSGRNHMGEVFGATWAYKYNPNLHLVCAMFKFRVLCSPPLVCIWYEHFSFFLVSKLVTPCRSHGFCCTLFLRPPRLPGCPLCLPALFPSVSPIVKFPMWA